MNFGHFSQQAFCNVVLWNTPQICLLGLQVVHMLRIPVKGESLIGGVFGELVQSGGGDPVIAVATARPIPLRQAGVGSLPERVGLAD